MPATLRAALLPFIVAALATLTTKCGLDAKSLGWQLGVIALALATLLVAAYTASLNWLTTKSKKTLEADKARAEALVPGVTSPLGPIAPKTTIFNDPDSPNPPIVITEHPETKG